MGHPAADAGWPGALVTPDLEHLTPCGRTTPGVTGRIVGDEGTSVNVPSGATERTFRPFAVGGDVDDPPWVTTWRNLSVESRANWKQLPVVLRLTCWISIGSSGRR